MSCRKIPIRPTQPVRSVGEGPFFWLLFFGPAKKSHPPKAEASVLHPFKQKQKPKARSLRLRPVSHPAERPSNPPERQRPVRPAEPERIRQRDIDLPL